MAFPLTLNSLTNTGNRPQKWPKIGNLSIWFLWNSMEPWRKTNIKLVNGCIHAINLTKCMGKSNISNLFCRSWDSYILQSSTRRRACEKCVPMTWWDFFTKSVLGCFFQSPCNLKIRPVAGGHLCDLASFSSAKNWSIFNRTATARHCTLATRQLKWCHGFGRYSGDGDLIHETLEIKWTLSYWTCWTAHSWHLQASRMWTAVHVGNPMP